MEPSDEQRAIVRELETGRNIVVDAVAGSGKTTTIIFAADALKDRRILILTYNQKLKEETRQRLLEHEHVDVHNYHSFVHNVFKVPCHDDKMMSDFVSASIAGSEEPTNFPQYDLVILDEVQDMTPLYFQLVHLIRSKITQKDPQLCCLGDRMQCIYEFMKADARFITSCQDVFQRFNRRPWAASTLRLATTFRMAHPTAAFLNRVFLLEDRLVGHAREGNVPIYIHDNLYQLDKTVPWLESIVKAIQEFGPGNTFVLAPSLRSANSPVRRLENFLVQYMRTPCYVPTADERELNRPAMSGKVVFSTFHQSKGMERDLVLVYGIEDSSIHRYTSRTSCDNKLYVALTRSKKQLIVLQDETKPVLAYVNAQQLPNTSRVLTKSPLIRWLRLHPHVLEKELASKVEGTTTYPRYAQVTGLLRHCHFEDLAKLEEMTCTYETVHPPQEDRYKNILMMIPNHVVTKILPLQTEEISDLTGMALQAWIEFKIAGTLLSIGQSSKKRDDDLTPQTLLLLTNDYDADVNSSYQSRRRQISDTQHNWLLPAHLEAVWTNFSRKIGRTEATTFAFEVPVHYKVDDLCTAASAKLATSISGRIDILETDSETGRVTVWELKFVSQIQSHHIVQAAIYGILYSLSTGIDPDVLVYNMKTDHLIRVYLPESKEHALDCLRLLLYFKSSDANNFSDELFQKNAETIAKNLLKVS